ncbi:MAG: AsmA family protein [Hyphomicrobiales bacterium]
MRLLKYLFFVLVLIVIAVLAVPFFIPADVIADQVVRVTKDKTGRDLVLGGNISFSVYPDLAVSMRNVSLSNPPDMARGTMLTTRKLRLSLEVMPLLNGDIKVKTFELVEPNLNLVTDVKGRSNWSFAAASGETASAEPASSDSLSVRQLSLNDIRIVDGVVRYLDETAGTAFEGKNVNVALSLPQIEDNLDIRGELMWRGEKIEITSVIGPIAQINKDKTAKLDLDVKSAHLSTRFKGVLSLAKGFGLNGTIDTASPSLRALANWAGSPLAAGRGLKDFSAAAKVQIGQDKIALSDAKIGLDGMRAQGNMAINTAGARPAVSANLGVDRIDLNQYLSEKSAKSSGSGDQGWSDQPFDFTGLKAVDAELRLAASQIRYQKTTIGQSLVNVAIKNGQLKANLEKLSLYDGLATGFLVLEGAKKVPTLAAGLAAERVSALPLLRDFAEFDWIEGTAKLTLRLSAQGRSQKQMVSSLGGRSEVLFKDGAVRGINIAQMMRGLGTNILSGWSRSDVQKTDFASLSASYAIAKGIAVNNDLQMIGPLVRLRGEGTVDMPRQRLDYKVDPKLVASLQGQGGESELAGFNVPIVVEGPWSKPKIYPDIAGVLDNPAAALKQLKGLGKIDPSKLGVNPGQLLKPGTDGTEGTGGTVKQTIEETIKKDGGGTINDLIQGFGIKKDENTETNTNAN